MDQQAPSEKKRRGLRPLSQTGFPRIPANPRQRRIVGGVSEGRNALDKANERYAENGRTLHPTKGFRKLNAKRSVAAMLVAEVQAGALPCSMKLFRRRLKEVQ